MLNGRFSTIEGIKEVPLTRVIVDVRSNQQKFMDWATMPRNFMVIMCVCATVLLLLPILLPFVLFVALIFGQSYTNNALYLPMRYPAWSKMRDPGQLHPGNDRPMMAEGIMFFGVVDAMDPYESGKQVFLSADDLTRHMLVLGTTGSGKSEFLKGMTFNVLCWASGFFVADAKADNKLPTDMYSQARMFARDYDFLVVNYLLGGLSPTEIAAMRERLSNGLQPATAADADTLVQMTSNMMVKASGDSKTWQERGLNLFRGIARALVLKRDEGKLTLTMESLREHLSLDKIEDLYAEGWQLAENNGGIWPTPYLGVKSYLEVGLPGFRTDILLIKRNLKDANGMPEAKQVQSNETFNQHGYRSDQVYPALSLLIDTYGHIFKRKYPEVDMQDVVVNNRICISLIPSLEKGAQEQESLGKLNLALLRVMMARALGSSVEGDIKVNVDAKITASKTPFALFLDEFAYQFAEGIALTAAQARSLNFFLCALAQDLEKLTEGERAAEAGAMMANQATKFFMKIVGSEKTHDLAAKTLGEAQVAVANDFERETNFFSEVRRGQGYRIEKRQRVSREVLESLPSGFATFIYRQRAHVMRTFYPSPSVPRVRYPRINRFLQVGDAAPITLSTCSVEMFPSKDKIAIERIKRALDSGVPPAYPDLITGDVIESISRVAATMNPQAPGIDRGITLYKAAVEALGYAKAGSSVLGAAGGGGSQSTRPVTPAAPVTPAEPQAAANGTDPATAQATPDQAAGAAQEIQGAETSTVADDLMSFNVLSEMGIAPTAIQRKEKVDVFGEEMGVEPGAANVSTRVTSDDDTVSIADEDAVITNPSDAADATPAVDEITPPTTESDVISNVEASEVATTPVIEPALIRQGLEALSTQRITTDVIERLGPQVVALKPAVTDGLAQLEEVMGATPEEARQSAANTEKAVAATLTTKDEGGVNMASGDVELMFAQLASTLNANG